MIRPQLEYASDVLDPYQVGDIAKLEKVQRRAARWVLNNYDRLNSVTQMLDKLSWLTLQTRRHISRLQTLHKVLHKQLAFSIPPYYLPTTPLIRQYYRFYYTLPHFSTTSYQHSFLARTVKGWNSLPINIIENRH